MAVDQTFHTSHLPGARTYDLTPKRMTRSRPRLMRLTLHYLSLELSIQGSRLSASWMREALHAILSTCIKHWSRTVSLHPCWVATLPLVDTLLSLLSRCHAIKEKTCMVSRSELSDLFYNALSLSQWLNLPFLQPFGIWSVFKIFFDSCVLSLQIHIVPYYEFPFPLWCFLEASLIFCLVSFEWCLPANEPLCVK